jgi:hypothetical protein
MEGRRCNRSLHWMFCCVPMASPQNCIALNWNVRGLNTPAQRQVVPQMVADHRCNLVCLQEMKMQALDSLTVASTLGPAFSSSY